MRKTMWAFVAVCLMAVSFVAQAQTALTLGVPATGAFSEQNSSQLYVFEGTAGDEVFVAVIPDPAAEIVARVEVYDAAGAFITQQVGSTDGTIVPPFRLGTDGRYTIQVVRMATGETAGSFTIRVDRAELRALVDGEAVQGALADASEVRFYSWEGRVQDLIGLYLEGIGGRAVVFTPSGEPLTTIYDFAPADILELPEDGTYTLAVATETWDVPFSLLARTVSPVDFQAGTGLTGEIDTRFPAIARVRLNAGDALDLRAALPADGDRSLAIVRLDGRESWESVLASSFGGEGDALAIDGFVVPEDGDYYLVLEYTPWDASAQTAGAFSLAIDASALPSLTLGETYQGRVESGTFGVTHLYQGRAGEAITITLERVSGLGTMGLIVASPTEVVLDLQSPGSDAITAEITLGADGYHRLVVWHSSETAEALDYSLTLTAAE
jgi:hypothetical protein